MSSRTDHRSTAARDHDERTNELLRAAAGASGQQRQRLLDEVVLDNLGLADAISRRYAGRGAELDELNQVAYLGLVAAARRFDPGRGSDFVSFAVPTILGEVKRYFRDHLWSIRPPRRVQELHSAMTMATEELTHAHGAAPTAADLAHELGADLDDVHEAERAADCFTTVSIDQRQHDAYDDGPALHEALGLPESGYAAAEATVVLAGACRTLPARDARILYLRFFRGWTQQEIGDEIGVTQMQVSRLLLRILHRLRREIGEISLSA
ncbi:sigma-70 family RNA polymerase sigma factor [Jiangella rhizosphaerae]|uniref:Sigma-70 family RNA polymerase sigma factor n=1 Tax=Jiangella rhizosphaerae TaxID=2293569 RepID=A0A418KLA3_9ACTN|nr:sigma-70 family RNA polymerase sigma factor [Jiangella rhizosphaerae]RIQ18311.1 sigma-70 family RNA polymerase sigma factor [Jiangella rhizosphaerae]